MTRTTPETRVRERRPDDVPELARLLAEQQPTSSYPVRWLLPFPPEQFLVRTTEERAWVAERDGALLGHVALTRVDDDLAPHFLAATGGRPIGMVSVLFTALGARGTGAGGLLLDHVVAEIRASGRVPVLDVVPVHDVALAIYRRRGWVGITSVRQAWMTEQVPDMLLMWLPD